MSVRLGHVVTGPEGAPVVVLGPSLGTTLDLWRPQVDELSRSHRVVRYDHRGHGGSDVPDGPYSLDDLGADLLALLDALGVRRASFTGLSLGGMVGMWLAAHAPERVDRLALVCTAAWLPPADAWRERAAAVRRDGVAAVADVVLPRWFTPGYAETHRDVVARHRAMLVATPAEGYAGCCDAIAAMDLRADLPAVRAPTLVVAGAQDPVTPPEHALDIAARVPGAEVVVVPEAAHLANVEQPDELTRLLVEHLTATGA